MPPIESRRFETKWPRIDYVVTGIFTWDDKTLVEYTEKKSFAYGVDEVFFLDANGNRTLDRGDTRVDQRQSLGDFSGIPLLKYTKLRPVDDRDISQFGRETGLLFKKAQEERKQIPSLVPQQTQGRCDSGLGSWPVKFTPPLSFSTRPLLPNHPLANTHTYQEIEKSIHPQNAVGQELPSIDPARCLEASAKGISITLKGTETAVQAELKSVPEIRNSPVGDGVMYPRGVVLGELGLDQDVTGLVLRYGATHWAEDGLIPDEKPFGIPTQVSHVYWLEEYPKKDLPESEVSKTRSFGFTGNFSYFNESVRGGIDVFKDWKVGDRGQATLRLHGTWDQRKNASDQGFGLSANYRLFLREPKHRVLPYLDLPEIGIDYFLNQEALDFYLAPIGLGTKIDLSERSSLDASVKSRIDFMGSLKLGAEFAVGFSILY